MPDTYVEITKIAFPAVSAVLVAVLGGWGGYVLGVKKEVKKELRERKQKDEDRWKAQKQSHWSPLLVAAKELEKRFNDISIDIRNCEYYKEDPKEYDRKRDRCRDERKCEKMEKGEFCGDIVTCQSFFFDCCELYVLYNNNVLYNNMKRHEITDFQNIQPDPDQQRSKNTEAAQHTRRRMCHELTFTVSSVYKTAKYLAFAERVRRDLKGHLLMLGDGQRSDDRRENVIDLIEDVRKSFQGKEEAAGIFIEQQESIAEVVWKPTGDVITNFEFRQRLLETPNWEQFTNLLRFFVDFDKKLNYEVKDTIESLKNLVYRVEKLISELDRHYISQPTRIARWRRVVSQEQRMKD